MNKFSVMDLLLIGSKNAQTAKQLQKLMGYKHIREVTQEINRLRDKGEVILSENSTECPGYYLPNTTDELKRFVNSMNSRINEIKKSVLSAEKLLDIWGEIS